MKFLRLSSSLRTVFIFGAPVLGVAAPSCHGKTRGVEWACGKETVCRPASLKDLDHDIRVPQAVYSTSRSCPTNVDMQVPLTAVANGFSKPTYSYNVGGGRIIGEGSNVTWDLHDARPGFYRAIVEVQDHKKHRATLFCGCEGPGL